jgi:CRP/FNR family cyclic AMP-dependent transcriptional regulator
MDKSKLKSVPLFDSLSNRELDRVAQQADEIDIREGTTLARQGEFAYEFFIIEEGTARVTVDGEHRADLGPGDFFGEIGLVESERRTASVEAATAMVLIVITRSSFRQVEREYPGVAQQIRAAIRERLASPQSP